MAVHCQGTSVFELVQGDTRITYAPGTFDDEPQLHYSGPMGQHSFTGDEIQAFDSARGREVTVSLDRVSHLRTNTLTVFVPDLELSEAEEQSFRTVGIHATHRRTMTGGPGAALTSEALEFDGRARMIELGVAEPARLL